MVQWCYDQIYLVNYVTIYKIKYSGQICIKISWTVSLCFPWAHPYPLPFFRLPLSSSWCPFFLRNFRIWDSICTPHWNWHPIRKPFWIWHRIREFLQFGCFSSLSSISLISIFFLNTSPWEKTRIPLPYRNENESIRGLSVRLTPFSSIRVFGWGLGGLGWVGANPYFGGGSNCPTLLIFFFVWMEGL